MLLYPSLKLLGELGPFHLPKSHIALDEFDRFDDGGQAGYRQAFGHSEHLRCRRLDAVAQHRRRLEIERGSSRLHLDRETPLHVGAAA